MSETTASMFTDEDLKQSAHYETFGPAYFAARRLAERIVAGAEPDPLADAFKKIADKATDEMKSAIWEYAKDSLLGDMEQVFHDHIRRMVESTVEALLTGSEWAMKQYPLGPYHRAEEIRAAVAKHGGEPLLIARIADLEKEITRLRESLDIERRYR